MSTPNLKSYVCGAWHSAADGKPLVNPTTEEVLAESNTSGIDFGETLAFARRTGGPALNALTFAQRGELLGAMSKAIHAEREALIEVAIANGGNTRSDAKFDLDGATFTLSHYAKLGASLGDTRVMLDGEAEGLTRSPRYVGQHVRVPLTGAAIHINAYNFPAWGLCEKAAVALLAGMPVVTKPATSTALVAERMMEVLIEANILPAGALSFIAGSTGDLLDHVTFQDVIAFTGSADTGNWLRSREHIVNGSIRFNVEADSLNSAVLGPDVEAGSDTWDLFIREVARDITQKTGQKCTAIRRVFVPGERMAQVKSDLCDQLAGVRVGDPALREVKMGPVVTAGQLADVQKGIQTLSEVADVVYGDGGRGQLTGVEGGKGYFVSPTLLEATDPDRAGVVHRHEVFGPCSTLMPYSGEATEAIRLVGLGGGSLVSSVYTDDVAFAQDAVLGAAPYNGRITIGSARVAEHSPGPGTVLPAMVHGGPGRAGGGEELGGVRSMAFYQQRTAVQGSKRLLEKILK